MCFSLQNEKKKPTSTAYTTEAVFSRDEINWKNFDIDLKVPNGKLNCYDALVNTIRVDLYM